MSAAAAGERVTRDALRSCIGSEATQCELRLRCPRCSANLSSLACTKCWLQLSESDEVVHALPPDRVEHYAQFIKDYEHIRAAEGRGGLSDDFYLSLPYHDTSGKNSSQWKIRARSYDCLMKRVLAPTLTAGARILDLGAGNGWMSFRLALAGYKPCAVDLLTNQFDGLGAAERYRKHLPALFPRFQAELAHLPFQSGQFHAVVFNASFHYAEDAIAALREALRCLKSSGIAVICDTPWYSCDESGNEMVSERREKFQQSYGTASASIDSIEFLTDERLQSLSERLSIQWTTYFPNYGLWWAMRPYLAKLKKRREPARFRIYVAKRAAA
jgi:SAM-dependent methyltransferase